MTIVWRSPGRMHADPNRAETSNAVGNGADGVGDGRAEAEPAGLLVAPELRVVAEAGAVEFGVPGPGPDFAAVEAGTDAGGAGDAIFCSLWETVKPVATPAVTTTKATASKNQPFVDLEKGANRLGPPRLGRIATPDTGESWG
jgi:hypothetical protein